MAEIDYKQVAQNVLKLLDKNVGKKMLECYIHYALDPDDEKYMKKYYTLIWNAMDIIDGK
jgi:hypothetical protein